MQSAVDGQNAFSSKDKSENILTGNGCTLPLLQTPKKPSGFSQLPVTTLISCHQKSDQDNLCMFKWIADSLYMHNIWCTGSFVNALDLRFKKSNGHYITKDDRMKHTVCCSSPSYTHNYKKLINK